LGLNLKLFDNLLRQRRAVFPRAAHLLEVVDTARMDRGADQTVLSLQTLGQCLIRVPFGDQILIRRTLAGENGAAGVVQGKNDWCVEPLVLCLNVIDNSIMFDVGVESSNHSRKDVPSLSRRKPQQRRLFLNGNTSIFSRSISIFCALILSRNVA